MKEIDQRIVGDESDIDIYDRGRFAREIIEFASIVKTPFSAGLDSVWGSGKSYFIENELRPAAIKAGIPFVIYNAFEHEIEEDPFLSITSEIIQQVKAITLSDAGKSQKASKLKSLASASKNVALTTGTAFGKATFNYLFKISVEDMLEQIDFGTNDEKNQFSKEFISEISKKLKASQSKAKVISNFKASLKSSAVTLSPKHQKIIIVIDELDRCKPSTSLKILETIKHILSAEGVFFLFSYDRSQIESSVSHAYGIQKPDIYLHKFINIDFRFPISSLLSNSNSIFIQSTLKSFGLNDTELQQHRTEDYSLICTVLELSLRHIERSLVYFFKYLRQNVAEPELLKFKEVFLLCCFVVYKELDALTFANNEKFVSSPIERNLINGTDKRLIVLSNTFPDDDEFHSVFDLFRADKKLLKVTRVSNEHRDLYTARSDRIKNK